MVSTGGEQSGHIILSDYASRRRYNCGLQILSIALTEGKPISEVTCLFEPIPQLLRNIKVKDANFDDTILRSISETAEKQIGKMGRVLIRKSGTEEVIRVMVESEDEVLMLKLVDDINSKLLECEAK